MEGTMATIMMFAGNFAPTNWAFCDGSLQSISENEALYSLIGTTYGGDGIQTFALPDLRSRIPIGAGNGAGLPSVALGQAAGTETHTLTQSEMPTHVHVMSAKMTTTSNNANGASPAQNLGTASQNIYLAPAAVNTNLGGVNLTLGSTGSNQPFNIVQSYQAINYVICLYGIYPSRS
ncbi:MAG: tail fiber protein [Saprospiraceae bacterium]|nr:tail fiber protein [Saprospiraceae bacterium]